MYQISLVTAEKPQFGLGITVAAGCTNIVLDAAFVALFGWGLVGAALATVISQVVGGLVPLIYFASGKCRVLHLTRFEWNASALIKACTNGSSEMMTNLSLSIVNILYNYQLMKFIGEDGVAAYGVIMYVNFIFISVFIGYSVGSAPIISYHYGAQNINELKSLRKSSIDIIAVGSLLMTLLALILSETLSGIFVGYDKELFSLTKYAFCLYSVSYLFIGFNIFSSAFFTALNNGVISAFLSFVRTLALQVLAVMLLPLILDIDGIWLSIVVAEFLAFALSLTMLIAFRKRYQY